MKKVILKAWFFPAATVTDLKRLEEQLIQAEKLAAMGQMLAGVAHELNNPLTAILGVTELLRERPGADDSLSASVETHAPPSSPLPQGLSKICSNSRALLHRRKNLSTSTTFLSARCNCRTFFAPQQY